MFFKEVEIPVPWGIIAGKCFGDETNALVIAVHGYQDNANSFDPLIPLLPSTYCYIAIDLPNHGKSSHLMTKGLPNFLDFIYSVKLVLDHYKRDKYILLGHSFGAQIMVIFAQIFPELVEKLICLDAYYSLPVPAGIFIYDLRETFNRYTKLSSLNDETAPTYTLQESIDRMRNSRVSPISEEAATVLIQRSLIPVGNDRYKISTSQQLKYYQRPPFSLEYIVELLKHYPILCPHLIIGASSTRKIAKFIEPLLKQMKKNPRLKFIPVEGTHDVHMEHPERIAPHLTTFLLKKYSKL